MKIFVIEIIPPDKTLNETDFTGYCQELGIITQGSTLLEALNYAIDLIPDMLEVQAEMDLERYNQTRTTKFELPKYDIHIKMPENA